MLPFVDIHGHYCPRITPDSAEQFRRLVDSPEIHRVVVCALDLRLRPDPGFTWMSTFGCSNEQLEAVLREVNSPKLLPFCYVDPRQEDAPAQLRHWITERGMRGLKLYPPEGWYPSDPRCIAVCAVAQELDIPVLMHMGRVASHPQLRSEYARPIFLEELGLACPKLKLIIGHFAGPWYGEASHIAMSFPQWTFDLATAGHWDLQAIKNVCALPWDPGIKRFVLGTDGSGPDILDRCRAIRNVLAGMGFSEEELDQVCHHNGLRVLGES